MNSESHRADTQQNRLIASTPGLRDQPELVPIVAAIDDLARMGYVIDAAPVVIAKASNSIWDSSTERPSGRGRDARVHQLAHGLYRRFGDATAEVPAEYELIASHLADAIAFMLPAYSTGYLPSDYYSSPGHRVFIEDNLHALYVVASTANLRTTEWQHRGNASYRKFKLENSEVSIWALVHIAVPIVAFTASHRSSEGEPYPKPLAIDPPMDVLPLKQSGWRVMTARAGNGPPDPELLVDFRNGDMADVNRFGPETLFDVAFNRWD